MHAASAGDEVDEDTEEGQDDDEYHPQRLRATPQVVTAKDVSEDRNQQPDPDEEQEELQHRPKDVQQRVGVRNYHCNPPLSGDRAPGTSWSILSLFAHLLGWAANARPALLGFCLFHQPSQLVQERQHFLATESCACLRRQHRHVSAAAGRLPIPHLRLQRGARRLRCRGAPGGAGTCQR